MTTIAITRIRPRPCSESWNAWAVPWKLVVIVDGSVSRGELPESRSTASPSATPGSRLNEMVTDGSWPVWLTVERARLVVDGRDRVERDQPAARSSGRTAATAPTGRAGTPARPAG